MADLTPEEVSSIRSTKRTYTDYGFNRNLHKSVIMPNFTSDDEAGETIQNISPTFNIANLDARKFIKKSATARSITTLATGDTAIFTLTLTLKFSGLTLAIPRWSIYNPSSATELESSSNELLEDFEGLLAGLHGPNVTRSWQAIQGTNDIQHILKLAIVNASGGSVRFIFKGDWLYMGDTV